ncbi:hypothetical protein O181_073025 [Austropuccinia psidii MF-1]|uniref:Uncharacterized protein n=1 Tax=Austropuccinia psidii MF-1 TaxID=1389203 RepID=A0A9Q3F1N4_9BASI|nr:hypothetical protein [Austropuccinia psidii MF-1]
MQIPFWSEDKDIRYEMEDCDKLQKEMINKQGNMEPERRHRKDSLKRLFKKTQQEGGVKDKKIVELKKEEKEVSISQVKYWVNLESTTVSTPTEVLETHETLRQTKQILVKKESQNEEDSQSEKPIVLGTYHEDEDEEEMKIIVPTKCKDINTSTNEKFEGSESKEKENFEQERSKLNKKMVHHKTEKNEIINEKKELQPKLAIENMIKKILEQKINSNLKEILSVSPTFIQKLQGVSLEEKEEKK